MSSSGNTPGIRKVDTSDVSAFPTLGGGVKASKGVGGGAWGAPTAGEGGGEKEKAEGEVEGDNGPGGESVFKFAEEEGGGGEPPAKEEKREKEKKKKKKKKKSLDEFEG